MSTSSNTQQTTGLIIGTQSPAGEWLRRGTSSISQQYSARKCLREWRHAARKLLSTARIVATLGAARTFGVYVHTVWNGQFEYAVYLWRGRMWAVPTGAVEEDQ